MKRILYSKNEIDEIKKGIKPYTIIYLDSNRKPFYYLTMCIIGYLISIYISNISKYFVPFISFFTVRLFIIFHDCCHNSFFKVTEKQLNSGFRRYNNIIAEILEPLVSHDVLSWKKYHGLHHEKHGNMNEDDPSKYIITLSEYNNLSFISKITYRIIHIPILFFIIIAPLYTFWYQHMFKPVHMLKKIIFYYIIFKFGKIDLVNKVFIGQLFASTIGIMLFHLQHTVNIGYWERFNKGDQLSYDIAQLHGASMLRIPVFLKWITFGIEYHHIHHLSTRIPSYNLQKCHDDNEHLFDKITKVEYKQAFKSLFHVLYDENEKKYVSFGIDRFLGLQY